MSKRVTIVIPGEPIGWGRPTPVARLNSEGKPFVMMVTQEQTRKAKAAVLAAFRRKYPDHKPWTGPVLLRFTAIFETPKSFNKALRDAAARGMLYATKKPDKDNIEKLIKDALNGVVYCDDQQVMGGGLKRYGSPARVEISFESLESADVPATPGQKRAERAQQQPLPLKPRRPRPANPPKSKSDAAVLAASPRVIPDLDGWSPRQRQLIEAAMARDERARQERGK
jgi:Holliday junction resolvase RusA-like endonuclease